MVALRIETPTLPALAELQKLTQWVVWRLEKNEKGKLTKRPYNAYTGVLASTTDATTWATYEVAYATFRGSNGKYKGIGFVFNDDYTGVDFDHCVNPDGSVDEWAAIEIEHTASYAEISPSGTGVHVIARGLLPEGLNGKGEKCRPGTKRPIPNAPQNDAAIEMYCEGRFFTFTEKHLLSTPITIESRQDEILALHRKYVPPTTEKPKPVQRIPSQPLDISDNDLLSKAAQAKNSNKFVALWRGDTGGYGSRSEADQALCNLLAFWTANDASRMHRLFCQSGLYREDKWNRNARSGETYGEGTIRRAIEQCTEVYTPVKPRTYVDPTTENITPLRIVPTGDGANGVTTPDHANTVPTPNGFNLTDLGNAERFAARYKDRVRWCETWNCWLVFNKRYWEKDESGRVDQLAKATVRAIYIEAGKEEDEAKRKQIAKHAAASESNRAIRAMLDRAKSELPSTPKEYNTHIYLLNCKNGTLDLKTGELRPHNSLDMLTHSLDINYNPLAICTKWEEFINSVQQNNQGMVSFLQQALGMSLSGDVSEQCLFICHGLGSNGKTTMLEVVRTIMNTYGHAANIESFQMKQHEGIGNDIAELYGARFVNASENKIGSRLNGGPNIFPRQNPL